LRILLYLNTILYLKPIQVIWRIRNIFFKPKINTKVTYSIRNSNGIWVKPNLFKNTMTGPLNFNFLNKRFKIVNDNDWDNKSLDKLWLYNSHYFEDLLAEDAPKRKEWHILYIENWIKNIKYPNSIGWDPYPSSLRICNWIKWFNNNNSYKDEWISSLASQADLLSQRVEFQNMGNHLFVNAKALIFAGTFCKGSAPNKWLIKGLTILDKELDEQILDDGAHFELSPMYHSLILMDILDLINLANLFQTDELLSRKKKWKEIVKKMFNWGYLMNHPDGKISFFNDASFGIAPLLSDLRNYSDKLGINLLNQPVATCESDFAKVFYMKNSGYIRTIINKKVCLIKDCGKIGPDYIPAHGHADTLSFELSINQVRLFVNTGTSSYTLSNQRLYERGTLSHNTLTVDNKNSSEIWSNFRVAKRALPSQAIIEKKDNSINITCSHNGYKSILGGVTHQRVWQIEPYSLTIEDKLNGKFNHAVARFILHPAIQVALNKNKASFFLEDEDIARMHFNSENIDIKEVYWSSCFGKTQKTKCIEIKVNKNSLLSKIVWN
jgi:uncharacterized heparinase superfamily protein